MLLMKLLKNINLYFIIYLFLFYIFYLLLYYLIYKKYIIIYIIYIIILMSNNNQKYEKLISVWMDKMYDCKDNIHQVNPLFKILHENNILKTDKFKVLNNALIGFNSNFDDEKEYYDNYKENLNFKPETNDEINLVKLLANVNNKVIISKDVL
jgi:hypothetical protein